jgi:hypothetical protein
MNRNKLALFHKVTAALAIFGAAFSIQAQSRNDARRQVSLSARATVLLTKRIIAMRSRNMPKRSYLFREMPMPDTRKAWPIAFSTNGNWLLRSWGQLLIWGIPDLKRSILFAGGFTMRLKISTSRCRM